MEQKREKIGQASWNTEFQKKMQDSGKQVHKTEANTHMCMYIQTRNIWQKEGLSKAQTTEKQKH